MGDRTVKESPSHHDTTSEPSYLVEAELDKNLSKRVTEGALPLAPAFLSRQTSATLLKRSGSKYSSFNSVSEDAKRKEMWGGDQMYPLHLMFTASDHNTSLPDDLHRTVDLTSSQSCKNIPCALRGRGSPDILKTASDTHLNDTKKTRLLASNRSYTFSDVSSSNLDRGASVSTTNGGTAGDKGNRGTNGGTNGFRRDYGQKKVKQLQKLFEEQHTTNNRFQRRYKTGVKQTPSDPGPSPPANLIKKPFFGLEEEEKRLSLDSSLTKLDIKVDQDTKRTRSGFPSRFGKKLARKFIPHSVDTGSLLQYAITNHDVELVEKLLQRGDATSEVNVLYPPGVSVLHQACALGNFTIVKLLIEKGADVRVKTWNELSPTQIAARFGHFDVTQLLLLTGGDVDDVRNGLQC